MILELLSFSVKFVKCTQVSGVNYLLIKDRIKKLCHTLEIQTHTIILTFENKFKKFQL